MGYRVLADATVVVHFAVLVFLLVGGFIAWRWKAVIWPHIAMAVWGLSITLFGWKCPLTWLENWARQQGGQAALKSGFIDTYLTGVIYPARYTAEIQVAIGVIVVVSWIGLIVRSRGRRLSGSTGTVDKTDISEPLGLPSDDTFREDRSQVL